MQPQLSHHHVISGVSFFPFPKKKIPIYQLIEGTKVSWKCGLSAGRNEMTSWGQVLGRFKVVPSTAASRDRLSAEI